MSENYLTQEELEVKGLKIRLEEIEVEVARRCTLVESDLELEDRARLLNPKSASLRYPPVFSIGVFLETYESLVRGMIVSKFRVEDFTDQEDCFQDVCTRLVETKHLLCYRPLIVRYMDPQPPIRKEKEREASYLKRKQRWDEKVAPHAGRFKVSYPSFQTHVYTITQTCCVNRGVREGRDPSTTAVSLALQYDDDDSSTLLERIFDTKAKNHEDLVIYGELLTEFERYLVDKYCTRPQEGRLVDFWGPDLPMLQVMRHTEQTPAISYQDNVPLVEGDNGVLVPKIEGIHSRDSRPMGYRDNVPMVYGDKGRLIPKTMGMPVLNQAGEPVYEETGETVHRSLAQVFRFWRQGLRQGEIARILQVTTGSPGNWVTRIRQDWVEFLQGHGIVGELTSVLS